jgi:histone H3/H4
MAREESEDRRQRRRETQKRAREAVSEERLEAVLRAAGARNSQPEARRALRALVEEELSRYAEDAVQIAMEREEESVSAESVACAASRRLR